MLSERRLRSGLPARGLGLPLYFYPSLGSTNERAVQLARGGAPHGTLVVAEAQTSGRGRGGRPWYTPAGSALAFSLVMRPSEPLASDRMWALNVLGALAVVECLRAERGKASIKWPNDVLLQGRKLAGVLTEASWIGERVEYAVVGVGINVHRSSTLERMEVDFPAISVEQGLGRSIDRTSLLLAVLESIGRWWVKIGNEGFLNACQQNLAMLGSDVELKGREATLRGRLEGITREGRLRLRLAGGKILEIEDEGYHLRQVDTLHE